MARVSTYLNFDGRAEEALAYYGEIFGTEPSAPVVRFADMAPSPDGPTLAADDARKVMHAELPILGGHVLMATDLLESLGQQVKVGNNVTLNLEPDDREDADRLYGALADGGSESTGMQDVPWGYWGCTLDRFGIRWMFHVAP
ncbi:MAG: VOC family protein [Acidimicrobiales bacterium]